eukprot:4450267-Amphidinium_carterae.1
MELAVPCTSKVNNNRRNGSAHARIRVDPFVAASKCLRGLILRRALLRNKLGSVRTTSNCLLSILSFCPCIPTYLTKGGCKKGYTCDARHNLRL